MTPASSERLVPLLAVITGGVVANVYYCQPLLDHIARSLAIPAGKASLIAASTQLGYGLGMLLLAPLGDLISRRRVILGQFLLLVPALLLFASSPDLPVLLLAATLVGLSSTIVQQIISLSATLVAPAATGRAVGTVMMGLTLGILLSRPLEGYLDELAGWRATFVAAAGLAALLGIVAAMALPDTQPARRMTYSQLLNSLPGLLATRPTLQRAALSGLLWAAAFNAFWVVLVFHLSGPPFGFAPGTIGLFGMAAAGGALASRPAGRLVDRRGPRFVLVCGLSAMLLAFVLMEVAASSAAAILAGALLLDAGVFASQIGNQSILLQSSDTATSRVNALYMMCYCVGAAGGAALAWPAWSLGGWRLGAAQE